MSTLTIERPARTRASHATVARRRPAAPAAPVVSSALTWDEALELVRGVLDNTQLSVAISHAAPENYRELCAAVKGLSYWGTPGLGQVAEGYAVRGLMELGIVALHNRAAEIDDATDGHGRGARDLTGPMAWPYGNSRREDKIRSLVHRIIWARDAAEWDHSPAAGEPAMPVRERASRYVVAPGLTATADDIVSLVFGWWMTIDDPCVWRAPVISGEIDAWFRALVHRLWTLDMVAGVLPEHQDAKRERDIRIERETLAERLEFGDEVTWRGQASAVPMNHRDVSRLRFVEYHLGRAFKFCGYDARTRWARQDIGAAAGLRASFRAGK